MAHLVHAPSGTSHPYELGPQARVPFLPREGEPVRIGVLASSDVEEVYLEVDYQPQGRLDDGVDETREGVERASACAPLTGPQRYPAARVEADSTPGAEAHEGHLTQAQAASAGSGGWVVSLPAPGGRWRYRFVSPGEAGQPDVTTPWWEVSSAVWEDLDPAAVLRTDAHPLPDGVSAQGLAKEGRWQAVRVSLPLAPEEHVLGLGERYDAVDQRGHVLDTRVFEQYTSQWRTPYSYFPQPFLHVLGGRGWSVFVPGTARVVVDAGASTPDRLVVEVPLSEPGQLPPEPVLEVWEGTPHACVNRYLDRTGRPQELPEWVLGLWASGNEWNTQAMVQAQVARHEVEDVPVSVVVVEAWSDEEGFCAFRDSVYHGDPTRPYELEHFEFPPDGAWPDPAGMITDLHERGIRLVLWQIPLQKQDVPEGSLAAAQREALLASGHVVRTQDGAPYRNRGWWFPGALMPDLTTPEGASWWTQWRRYLVRDLGVDGFKTDGGEHGWGQDLRFADGTWGEEGANAFPVAYARAYGDLLASEGRAPVTFSRAGHAGSAAHGAFWAGDERSTWQAMAASMRAGITAGACGVVYWGWDIAGFSGPLPEAELYLRAWGASVFVPIMQYHSEYNGHRLPCHDRTPWNIAEQSQDSRVLPVVRRLTRMRERLRPYLADQAHKAVVEGHGLMEPVAFVSRDPRAWDHETQYLLGQSLTVSPVTRPGADGEDGWTMLVPEGEWVCPWDGQQLEGPAEFRRRYEIDEVPVLVRAEDWPRLREVFTEP